MKQLVRLRKNHFLSLIIKSPRIVPSHKHDMQIVMEFSGETSPERGRAWRLMAITNMVGDLSTPHLVGSLICIKVRQTCIHNIQVNNLRPKREPIWSTMWSMAFILILGCNKFRLWRKGWVAVALSVPTCKSGLTRFSPRVPGWCWGPHMKQGWHCLQLSQIWCNDTTKSAEVINGSTFLAYRHE